MLQHTNPQPTALKATPYKTVKHNHGRYPVITGDKFIYNDYAYSVNITDESGVRLDILTPLVDQLAAMQSIYSRVLLSRFDLHLPAGTPVDIANEWMRQLFKTLRERLTSKHSRPKGVNTPINNFAYGWVREKKEEAKQVHYHCWIALPHRQVQRLGGKTYGVASAIVDIWCKLTGGAHTLVELAKKSVEYSDHYVIERSKPETLAGPIWWVSYLAKERCKYQTGKGDRLHSTSKLGSKV